MSADLKRQASDLYRERDELGKIRTSEHLSVNKIVYASLAIMVLALVAVKIFGGFSRRVDPIIAATTPPQVVKEAPPPELLEEPAAQSPPTAPAPSQATRTSPPIAVPPKPAEAVMAKAAPVPPPPASRAAPGSTKAPSEVVATAATAPPATAQPRARQAGPRLVRETQSAQTVSGKPARREAAETKAPAPPPQPVLSELEQTRRQLARDILLESNPALPALLGVPDNKGWQADPINADEYNVVFNIIDRATGTPVQYIWKVNLSTRAVTPLSYYARRL